ncbi:MAG TPA: TIGR00730 family Rossman fold protein [Bryobacteraceae bacterium]
MSGQRLCVFCGSNSGAARDYSLAAADLGHLIGTRGLGLVYGGSNVGLMGILADAALEAGASVTGVIPRALVEKEVAHRGLTELRIVETMHERKALMADLADAFIAMPGGYGTFDELCEILTWAQLGIHAKPVGLLNTRGYWDPFLRFLDHSVASGFLKPGHRGLIEVRSTAAELVDVLFDPYRRREVPQSKWASQEEIL